MIVDPRRLLKAHGSASAALVGLLVAACTPQYLPAQQVQASNPTVTYKYYTDDELLQVNQTALTFCNQYQASPRAASFATNTDQSKQVVFECVKPIVAMTPTPYNSNLVYDYQTDQDLLTASRNAQAYCSSTGSQQVFSNIVSNTNGSKTVTFQCSRS